MVDEEAVLVGFCGGGEAGFVDEAEALEARGAFAGVDDFEEVDDAVSFLGHEVPEAFVAAGPEHPGVAAFDFLWGELDAGVHAGEDIGGGGWEVCGGFSGGFGFIGRVVVSA